MSGGRFRSILPSDLRFVGACARESIPIPVRSNLEAMRSNYSSSIQKQELLRMFRRLVVVVVVLGVGGIFVHLRGVYAGGVHTDTHTHKQTHKHTGMGAITVASAVGRS